MTVTAVDPWTRLEEWIQRDLADPPLARDLFDSPAMAPLRRLRDALASRGREGTPGPMDLAVLVRHALWSIRTSEAPTSTWVRAGDGWPTQQHWAAAGLLVATEGDGYRVILERWKPSWLPSSDAIEPGDASARGVWRRPTPDHSPADPFFHQALGLESYSSPGQREAVRALALAPHRGTVIANLPTGSGKSAVAYAVAALRARSSPAVAIVVVPTTALALDQDRAFRETSERAGSTCPDVLAYHGGLTKQAKADLRQRIRNGTQTIVFTSPESLLGGLRAAVFDAARRGLISLFAVDEAHIAVAWGEEFRPEFQFMAPLRDQLLELQQGDGDRRGFPTLLMSGTLTASAIDRLVRDFRRNGPVEVVSAAALRPEPEYWIAQDSDESDREWRVLNALAHLPRPAILYTTRPVHADQWLERLKAYGYRRVVVVHGATGEAQRQAAMAGMRGRRPGDVDPRSTIDLIVGTSAYGLGVDQPDVRTIVHACLPESLDRFYQEVGRSGRDGHASVSVLIPAFTDWSTARSLAQDAIISVEKARERWKSMRTGSESVAGGGRRVTLGEVPSYLFRESETNAEWNLRTLLLLQQADVLQIRIDEPPRRLSDETDEAWDERLALEWERQRTTRTVDLIAGDSEAEDLWRHVERTRQASASRGRAGFDAMTAVLRQQEDLAQAFATEYTVLPGDISSLPGLEIHVARACGGCPECRHVRRRVAGGYVPSPPPPTVAEPASELILEYFASGLTDLVLVLIEDWREPRSLRRLRRGIVGLVGQGLGSLVAPAETIDQLRDTLASRPVVVSTVWQPTALPDITTAVVALDSRETGIAVPDVIRFGPRRLVFVDPDTPDPDWRYQTLRARSHVITLDHLLDTV